MIVNSGLWVPSCLLCDTMEEFKPEDQLRHILSSIDWSYSRYEPENWTSQDDLGCYFPTDTFTLATLLPGRTGAGGVGLVATSPRPTLTSSSPSPSCSGLPRWGGHSCQSGRTCSSKYSSVVCCQVVLKCYQNYPKLYKRLGPTSKNGGLENFSLKVQSMKFLLEDLLTSHLRLSLPRKEF